MLFHHNMANKQPGKLKLPLFKIFSGLGKNSGRDAK